MSHRARIIATITILWVLALGGAVYITVDRGDTRLVFGAQQPCNPIEVSTGTICIEPSRPVIGQETHYDIARMLTWIAMISAIALAAVVITYLWTSQSGSQRTDSSLP
jgi:hypothetical protein